MSTSATKKKAHADAIPSIMGRWGLTVWNDPSVEMLNLIEITDQVPSGDQDLIRGRVGGGPSGLGYEIESGVVMGSEVSFNVTTNQGVYTFRGTVDGSKIKNGLIRNPSALPHEKGTEDGSWSAQAQGGTREEEETKHPRKHTKRSAR